MIHSGQTGRPCIATVTGDPAQRARVSDYLMTFYQCAEYADMPRAMAGCRARTPRLILVNEQLSASSGFDFVCMLRLDSKLATVPVLMLIAKDDSATLDRVKQCGADSCLLSSCSRSALVTAISGLLNHHVEQQWRTLDAVQQQALTGTLDLFNGIANGILNGEPVLYQAMSEACAPLVEAVASNQFTGILHGVRDHDNYSFAHSIRVATYLALFGFNLQLPKDEQVILASGGLLHDVGKMSIPHEILNKAGRLTEAEFAAMKGHVTASVNYLQACSNVPKSIITMAAQHHEKLDGTGYPLGLGGNKLNRLARMVSIIDVFSALTDRRVYKPSMNAETALAIMTKEMSTHLDMKLLGLFRQMLLDASPKAPRAMADSS